MLTVLVVGEVALYPVVEGYKPFRFQPLLRVVEQLVVMRLGHLGLVTHLPVLAVRLGQLPGPIPLLFLQVLLRFKLK